MKKYFLVIVLVHILGFTQTNDIQELQNQLKTANNDSIKADLYNKLTWKYLFNDKAKALELLNTTEKFTLKTNQKFCYNTFLNNKGIFFDVNGNSDSAKLYFEKALQYSVKNGFIVHEQNSQNNLGMFFWNKGKYHEALSSFFKALALAEKSLKNNPLNKIDANYNNIGLVYQEMELYEKAIPYHQKALKIRIGRNYNQGEAASYNNLGICYKQLGKLPEAKLSFEKGLEKAKNANDQTLYFNNIEGLAQIFALENNYQKALNLFLKSFNRPKEVPFNSNAKIKTVSGIADLYAKLQQPNKAIEYGEICISELSKDPNIAVFETDIYKILSHSYYQTGNNTKGLAYSNLFFEKIAKKFNQDQAKSLQELETKYETEKNEIALQNSKTENLLIEAKVKRRTTLLFSALSLALLLALIGFLVYKQLSLKNKQIIKENELKYALVQIENQNELQEQRLAISKDLHDNIGSQLTFIISSLDNLKYFEFTKEKLYDKFDTITGFTRSTITDLRDSIWAMNKEEITFEDLKARTTNFIEAAKTSLLGITFEFIYPPNSENITFNSLQGIDVYRIIQEAVNNAVKHAKATKISVNFEVENDIIEISIIDNGIGFDLQTVEAGNGLTSIRKRAAEINAQLNIMPLKQGTKIQLSLPIS